jgi:hypothetical protein
MKTPAAAKTAGKPRHAVLLERIESVLIVFWMIMGELHPGLDFCHCLIDQFERLVEMAPFIMVSFL